MKPAAFTYHRPVDIADALELLARHAAEDGRVIAGGQSLVPIMAFRLARPAHLIDISRVSGLDHFGVVGSELRFGALVRHAAFADAPCPGPLRELLARVMHAIAHMPIRGRGTFCGSLAHADPASEWCLVAATLDAIMVAARRDGEREIAARDFFTGVMSTALAPDELLREVRLPLLPGDARFGFAEFSRRAGDFAMASALAVLRLAGGVISEARIGVGGAEAFARRLEPAEASLIGQQADEAAFARAARIAAASVDPLEDAQTDAACRRDLVAAMVRRALMQTMTNG